jgi:hypothetical protein
VLQLNIGACIRVAHLAVRRSSAQPVLNFASERIATGSAVAVARLRAPQAVLADESRSEMSDEQAERWERATDDH